MAEKKKKVLLVEDDPAIIDIYQAMIQKAGFDVEVMSLGQEAIKKIKDLKADDKTKPDIMLLDLILPDMNGMEILKEIRKNASTRGIHVFVLTNQEESEKQYVDGIRPDKFIIKANITPTQLIQLIKDQLQ